MQKVSDEESEQYFHSRPRGSQIGAIVSKQVSMFLSFLGFLYLGVGGVLLSDIPCVSSSLLVKTYQHLFLVS